MHVVTSGEEAPSCFDDAYSLKFTVSTPPPPLFFDYSQDAAKKNAAAAALMMSFMLRACVVLKACHARSQGTGEGTHYLTTYY
jgi:hypothetical protein